MILLSKTIKECGVPGATRTHRLLLRREPLYPDELRGHGRNSTRKRRNINNIEVLNKTGSRCSLIHLKILSVNQLILSAQDINNFLFRISTQVQLVTNDFLRDTHIGTGDIHHHFNWQCIITSQSGTFRHTIFV